MARSGPVQGARWWANRLALRSVFLAPASDRCVSVWIPLKDTPLEAGAVQFAAGSHRRDHGRHLGISDLGDDQIGESIREHGLVVHREAFEMGDVSLHGSWTFHRAEASATEAMRGVMTVICIDRAIRVAESENSFQQYDLQTWAPGCAVGDSIASRINPVLYPVEGPLD